MYPRYCDIRRAKLYKNLHQWANVVKSVLEEIDATRVAFFEFLRLRRFKLIRKSLHGLSNRNVLRDKFRRNSLKARSLEDSGVDSDLQQFVQEGIANGRFETLEDIRGFGEALCAYADVGHYKQMATTNKKFIDNKAAWVRQGKGSKTR